MDMSAGSCSRFLVACVHDADIDIDKIAHQQLQLAASYQVAFYQHVHTCLGVLSMSMVLCVHPLELHSCHQVQISTIECQLPSSHNAPLCNSCL